MGSSPNSNITIVNTKLIVTHSQSQSFKKFHRNEELLLAELIWRLNIVEYIFANNNNKKINWRLPHVNDKIKSESHSLVSCFIYDIFPHSFHCWYASNGPGKSFKDPTPNNCEINFRSIDEFSYRYIFGNRNLVLNGNGSINIPCYCY